MVLENLRTENGADLMKARSGGPTAAQAILPGLIGPSTLTRVACNKIPTCILCTAATNFNNME
eukprot:7657648-Alexandrium_andersonii.AAC.1